MHAHPIECRCRTSEVIRVKESTHATSGHGCQVLALTKSRMWSNWLYWWKSTPWGHYWARRVGTRLFRCVPHLTFSLEVDADALWPLREGGGGRGGGVLAAGVDAHGAAVHARVRGAGGEEPQGVASLRHHLQSPPGAPAQIVTPADHTVRPHARHLHLGERRHAGWTDRCVLNMHVQKWTRPPNRISINFKKITITRSQKKKNGWSYCSLGKPIHTHTHTNLLLTPQKLNSPPLRQLQQ